MAALTRSSRLAAVVGADDPVAAWRELDIPARQAVVDALAPVEDAAPDEAETFTRDHVQELRDEAAGHRVKAERADALATRLVTAQAALTGKLADPTDLPSTDDVLDDDGLVDESEVQTAVDDLIKREPHLAARRPTRDVGQGARPEVPEISLGALLRVAPVRLRGSTPPRSPRRPSRPGSRPGSRRRW